MKVGDLVTVVGDFFEDSSIKTVVGTIVAPWTVDEWWEILLTDGRIVTWPESQMVVVNGD